MTDPTPHLLRACAYVRVSTKRQAEHETSLNEQETSSRPMSKLANPA